MNNPITLSPAAKAALMRASDLGQQRLQRLLAIEEKIVRNPGQYPELWELLQPSTTAAREAA